MDGLTDFSYKVYYAIINVIKEFPELKYYNKYIGNDGLLELAIPAPKKSKTEYLIIYTERYDDDYIKEYGGEYAKEYGIDINGVDNIFVRFSMPYFFYNPDT